jgi:hypothetical protein
MIRPAEQFKKSLLPEERGQGQDLHKENEKSGRGQQCFLRERPVAGWNGIHFLWPYRWR